MTSHRRIHTPGEPIQAVAGTPPPDPAATSAGAADDDLSQFEPGTTLPEVDPVLAEVAKLKAEVSSLRRQVTRTAEPSRRPQVPEMNEEDAKAECDAKVAKGLRPRAILTPAGWYTHPEMARVPGSLGNISPAQRIAGA